MRIVFCTDTLSRGGKERQMAVLTRNLLTRGHEVYWITQNWDKGNDYVDEYGIDKNRIFIVKSRSYFLGINPIDKQISGLKPDVVMSWDIRSSFWLLVLHFLRSWTYVNGTIRHGIRNNSFQHKLRSWLVRLSPFAIANSKAGFKANKLRLKSNRCVIYNAVDPLLDLKNERDKKRALLLSESFKEDINFDNIVLMISVANLVPYKDYKTVIEALSQLNIPYRYLIIGEGPQRKSIEDLIKVKGIQEKVRLLGRRKDVKELLPLADLFLHSSKGEGCSNAILEAISAKIPVVASEVGGTPEILPKKSGILFTFQNAKSLKSAILLSLKIDKNSEEFRKSNRSQVQKFSNERITDEFEEVFNKWISKK